jgi:hypothetical protein
MRFLLAGSPARAFAHHPIVATAPPSGIFGTAVHSPLHTSALLKSVRLERLIWNGLLSLFAGITNDKLADRVRAFVCVLQLA